MASTRQLLANNLKFLMAGSQDLDTQEKLSERSGVSQTTIGRTLRGETDAGVDTVESLARPFRLTASNLIDAGLIGRLSGAGSNLKGTTGMIGRVPLISWASVEMAYDNINDLPHGQADAWLESPFPSAEKSFCVKLSDISMYPEYREDEIVQIDPDAVITGGLDVLVILPGGRALFRRLQIASSGEKFFMAINPDWPDRIEKAPEGTVICGAAIGSWMDRRTS